LREAKLQASLTEDFVDVRRQGERVGELVAIRVVHSAIRKGFSDKGRVLNLDTSCKESVKRGRISSQICGSMGKIGGKWRWRWLG